MRVLVTLFLVLAGCATMKQPADTLSVYEVAKRHAELDGKIIRVRGVVKYCQHLSCVLYSTDNRDHFLSLGTSPSFDDAIDLHLGHEVVVEATLNDDCVQDFDTGVIVMCSDRSDTLHNARIVWPRQ